MNYAVAIGRPVGPDESDANKHLIGEAAKIVEPVTPKRSSQVATAAADSAGRRDWLIAPDKPHQEPYDDPQLTHKTIRQETP